MRNAVSKLFLINRLPIILILIGSLTWVLTMFKSGLVYEYGMGFWGANGRDGIWHIAVIKGLLRGTLEMPIYAGEQIKNYHIGFDLLVAGIHKLTLISPFTLYFQLLPVLFALLIGILVFVFVLLWKKSRRMAIWAVFFTYFGGSFAWILGKGESAFWSQQQISTLINPPFAMSLILILISVILCLKKRNFVIVSIVAGLILQAKAYGGVLFLAAILATALYQVIFRRDWYYFKVFSLTCFISLLLFIPLNREAGSLLVFQPFWFLETMMSYTDRVGWTEYFEAMTTYRASGNLKAIPAYIFAFVIFWVGNLGFRVIKEVTLISWVKRWNKLEAVEVFVSSVIVGGVSATLLFTQKGTAWNIIQFLYYALFFSGILAGITVTEILKKIKNVKLNIIFSIAVILLTIPTTIVTLRDVFLPGRPPAKVSNYELEALDFLANQPLGVVMTYPFDQDKAKEAIANPPRPLYLYDHVAYVSAFSNKPTYLEDETNVYITGHNAGERREKALGFLNTLDQEVARSFLRENNIGYIYWVKPQRAKLGEAQLGLVRIFENKEVDIYKVIK